MALEKFLAEKFAQKYTISEYKYTGLSRNNEYLVVGQNKIQISDQKIDLNNFIVGKIWTDDEFTIIIGTDTHTNKFESANKEVIFAKDTDLFDLVHTKYMMNLKHIYEYSCIISKKPIKFMNIMHYNVVVFDGKNYYFKFGGIF
jgi:hypothetical protein